MKKRNIDLEEFYLQKERENFLKKNKKYKGYFVELIPYIILFIFSFITFTSSYITTRTADIRSRASVLDKTVYLFLFPAQITTPVNQTFNIAPKIVLPDNKKAVSIIISIHFDRTKMKVVDIPIQIENNDYPILKNTGINDSNTTGVLKIMYGIKDPSVPIRKAINLPQLTFITNSLPVSLNYDTGESQVVFANGDKAELTVNNSVDIVGKYNK